VYEYASYRCGTVEKFSLAEYTISLKIDIAEPAQSVTLAQIVVAKI